MQKLALDRIDLCLRFGTAGRPEIAHGRGKVRMPHVGLDGSQVEPGAQQRRAIGTAKLVQCPLLAFAKPAPASLATVAVQSFPLGQAFQRAQQLAIRPSPPGAEQETSLWVGLVPCAQLGKQIVGDRDISLLGILDPKAITELARNPEHFVLRVNVAPFQVHNLLFSKAALQGQAMLPGPPE